MLVQKFGGTSVGSAARFRALLDIIPADEPVVVVLSAMSGTTNTLVAINTCLAQGNKSGANELIGNLEIKYAQTVEELIAQGNEQIEAINATRERFAHLKAISCARYSQALGKEILAQGELLSTGILHHLLKWKKRDAALLDALELVHLNAQGEPDKPFIANALKAKLKDSPNKLFILQGFIAQNHLGEIDNLARGGSDYTAALIGQALNAKRVEIWTDIDGFHNNDPRFVQGTKALSHLSFNEAAELAYFGAKILHPLSVLPCQEANIPVLLKNTMEPELEGTLISDESTNEGIRAVAAKDGIVAIKIKSGRMLMAYGFLRKVFEIFEKHRTPIDMITTSEVAVSLTIDDESYLDDIVKELQILGQVEVDQNQSIVCIVGDFISTNTGYAKQIFSALEEIPIRMISYGGSRHNISLVVATTEKQKTLSALSEKVL